MENNYEPSERDKLVHRWKCYMDTSKGDLGQAALIKKQLEKDKPVPQIQPNILPEVDTKGVIVEEPKEVAAPPIKRGRGRPRKT